MRYLSLFSGVGGFEVGIENAYCSKSLSAIVKDRKRGDGPATERGDDVLPRHQPPLCVGYSEIDKYAIETYKSHFGGHKNYGDATKINERELPDFDLLVGGFPCQAFSIAGKRKGFDDTRGTLFFDIARILNYKRPKYFLLENVKGLLSHDSGKTFQTILGVLSDIGYIVEWQVLNAKDFGVPQNRERIFIVGHLKGECSGQVFPITGKGGKDSGQRKPVFSTIRATYPGNWNGDYIDTDTKYRQEEKAFESARIRRLTPIECERLMSWPDNWTIGSDTQRYKQCGNGVVSNVVEAVIRKMMEVL